MRDTITRSIRLRLLSPVGSRWDDVGPELRALRSVVGRMMDAGVLEEIIAKREGRKSRRLSAIKEELAEIQKHSKNERTKELTPAAAITDAIQQRSGQQAKNWLTKRFKQSMRIPSAGWDAPIYVRDGCWRLEVNGNLALSVKLRAGRVPWHRFACAPIKGAHWEIVRQLASGRGDHKPGDCKIVYSTKRKQWQAIVTVTSPAPDRADGGEVIAVHRGMHNFLYYVTTSGHFGVLRTGTTLVAKKQKIKARKRSLQRAKRELGRGSVGRGRKRKHAVYRAVDESEKRFVRTYCQQTAAEVGRVAAFRGCGVVVREEYGGIPEADGRYIERFPFYQLGECIDWVAKKAGLEIEKAPSEYISTSCPRCGECSEKFHNTRTGTFHCEPCGFERPADFVACLHLLRRSGADMGVWERRFAALEQLKEAATGA